VKNLSEAFSALNKCLFQNMLGPVKFVLVPSEKHVLHLRLPDIIEIGSGLTAVSVKEFLDELVHIMVHMDNYRLGILDFTNNQYHRHEFCKKALHIGLMVGWHKTRGWSLTTSDPKSPIAKSAKIRVPLEERAENLKKSYEIAAPFCSGINSLRRTIRQELRVKPQKLFQLKYICSCDPPVIIRSGRRPDGPKPLDVSCNICGTKFVLEGQVS
jgi:hypothetical protein